MAIDRRTTIEEDDLDDLDDIVDQFDPNPQKPTVLSRPAPSLSNPSAEPLAPDSVLGSTSTSPGTSLNECARQQAEPDDIPEDLAKQLAESMESFMRELSGSQAAPTVNEEEKRLREEWEKMLIEGMNGLDVENNAASSKANSMSDLNKAGAGEDEFQRSIRAAMDKLKNSDSALNSDASTSAASADPLENILNSFGSGFENLGEDSEELQGMLETMMKQLMSKEVLYEPLKELHDKFPGYIKEHETSLSAEDKARYQNQLQKVTEIVAIFEEPTYTDDNYEKNAKVVTLMNEMQSYGSPPAEIMGPMPPGMSFGADGAPKLPDDCIIS